MPIDTNFGDESAVGIRFERFKFTEEDQGRKKRIVFIDKKVLKESVHYQDGYGYMRCLAPEPCPACLKGMRPNDRFGTVILEYYTDMEGNVSKPFGYAVKAFVFGNGKGNGTFSILHGIHKVIGEKMYSQDFVVSCMNPKYQTLNFLPTGACHLLDLAKTNAQAFQEAKADYHQKMEEMDILKVVAPYVTADIMQQVVDGKIVRRSTKNVTPAPAQGAPVQGAPAQSNPTQGVPPVSNFSGTAGAPVTPAVVTGMDNKVAEAKGMMADLSVL